jgi:hypothetical protein
LGADTFAACGGNGGPGWYEPETTDYEMPAEAARVLLAETMHWSLEYGDGLELRERLEVFTVLNARTLARNSQIGSKDDDE